MVLRSRYLVTATAPPIEDGAVWISGHRVRAAGPWEEIAEATNETAIDLGDAIIFPGWINAHCHLDYTNLAGQLSRPRAFPDWIKGILAAKAGWGISDFAASWLAGARDLLETGTTTVANIESVPEMLAEVRTSTPLRIFSFLEMTGVRSRVPGREILDRAIEVLAGLPPTRGGFGLSPHAPYSTHPDLIVACAEAAKRDHWLITTHVAESKAEFDMYMYKRGPMFEWLEHQRDMGDCGLGSPIGYLARQGLLSPHLLAVHANYVWEDDIRLLASRGVSVAHCPRSHTYFRHQCFPLGPMMEMGINICLGTDSLASVVTNRESKPTLSMQAELKELHQAHPSITPRQRIRFATQNPARALGLKGIVGELWTGSLADLAVIPYSGPLALVEEATVSHSGKVGGTMIGGRWEWIAPDWANRIPIQKP